MAISEKHREMAAVISDDLRREVQESVRLQRCEHDHDFNALVTDIIQDLEVMAAKYRGLLQDLYTEPTMSDDEVNETVTVLLKELPSHYPPAQFTNTDMGYWLKIDGTIIFRNASGEDAIKHTQNYVDARRESPNLPIGVIYGIYD